jgi:hypothetical protein
MVDLETHLREHGAGVDSSWIPITADEVLASHERTGDLVVDVPAPVRQRRPWRTFAYACVAVLALFIPIWLVLVQSQPSDPVTPQTPSPSVPDGMVLFTNLEDGYELELPESWDEWSIWGPGVRRFGRDATDGIAPALAISVGDPDGSVTVCPIVTGCLAPVVLPSLQEIRTYLYDTLPLCRHLPAPDVQLGSEQARVVSSRTSNVCMGGPASMHVIYAIHDDRPVLLQFDSWTLRTPGGDELVAAIIDSFRFIEPSAPVVPPDEPVPPSGEELELFTNHENGYEVMLPDSWIGEDSGGEANLFLDYAGNPYPGVRRFGEAVDRDHPGGASGRPALTISVGGADGTVLVCHTSWCDEVVVGSLEELQEVLAETEGGCGSSVSGLLHFDTRIGDIGARAMLRGSSGGCFVAESPGFYYIYAIDEGRPVILAFDQVTAQFSAGNARDSQQILASFRLIEPDEPVVPSGEQLELFINVEDGYEILLPTSWIDMATGPDGSYYESEGLWAALEERGDDPLPGVRRFGVGLGNDRRPALTISVGRPDGTMVGCQSPVPTPCTEVHVPDLDAMREYLVETAVLCDRFSNADISVDGVPGRVTHPRGPGSGCISTNVGTYAVYTVHLGRPILLAFDYWTAVGNVTANVLGDREFVGLENLDEILASFRFLTETSGS